MGHGHTLRPSNLSGFQVCDQPSQVYRAGNRDVKIKLSLKTNAVQYMVNRGSELHINSARQAKLEITGAYMKNCMLHYAGYRNIFPLWALGEYRISQDGRKENEGKKKYDIDGQELEEDPQKILPQKRVAKQLDLYPSPHKLKTETIPLTEGGASLEAWPFIAGKSKTKEHQARKEARSVET
ncbi:hypothetical protein RJ639_043603 [Escallonia herrerae]|uniref:Uncharacterized protein n=1 Tax=Escallonia herrerae TaxID=1293975 RepID=A0AA88WDX8_9ASTE|nr:hypothetical protein RJ639_043603 [Escallonia herrerae]